MEENCCGAWMSMAQPRMAQLLATCSYHLISETVARAETTTLSDSQAKASFIFQDLPSILHMVTMVTMRYPSSAFAPGLGHASANPEMRSILRRWKGRGSEDLPKAFMAPPRRIGNCMFYLALCWRDQMISILLRKYVF